DSVLWRLKVIGDNAFMELGGSDHLIDKPIFSSLNALVMIGAKLNIFRNEWLDVIFRGRNQLYGAYVLRKESASVVTKALFMGSALFVMGIGMPLVWKYIQ